MRGQIYHFSAAEFVLPSALLSAQEFPPLSVFGEGGMCRFESDWGMNAGGTSDKRIEIDDKPTPPWYEEYEKY